MNVYAIADDLTQDTSAKERRKARRKARAQKIKAGFKRLGKGLATVFLAPARGAFYAYVALNINGIANQLKWVFDNEKLKARAEANAIRKKLKDIGVRKFGTLLKSINTGAKKKPLFISKRAKSRLQKTAKSKGFKVRGINGGEDGIYLEPATTATIIASSAAVVGAIIPIILKAMEKKGDPGAVQAATVTGEDTLDKLKQSPEIRQYQAENPQPQPENYPGEAQEMNGIGRLDPSVTNALTAGLSSLANIGIQAAGRAVERRAAKNPKLRAVLQRGNDAVENYAAGQYLRRAGAIDDAKAIGQSYSNITKYLLPVAAVGAAILLIRKK